MMESSDEITMQDLPNIRVYLFDKNKKHQDYFRNIFDFVSGDLHVIPDLESAKREIKLSASLYLAVFLGDDLDTKELKSFKELIDGLAEPIPVFVVQGEARELKPKHGYSHKNIIGNIELPVHFDTFVTHLHKAEVFAEAHCKGKKKGRSVELFRSLSGNSRATKQINRMIEQVADSEATVLILGESGTGKEVVARKLHFHSHRRGKPFVPVNCGAIPADLLESELFGHEKGAFTGAISARQGRFEMADGGTLFLDEIGDMSMPMQVKLLRVLQERSFERVGSNKTVKCNVRIIAATHRNLEKAIETERFREDLYYRLNVFPIEMPPLRERVEDIPILATDIISRIENEKRGSVRLTPAAVAALCQYSWPGNVRELANLIERMAILYPFGVVDSGDLPDKFKPASGVVPNDLLLPEVAVRGEDSETMVTAPRLPHEGFDLKVHLNNLEKNLIQQALEESEGVVAHAAKRLQMRRTTLVEKLRKYGLQRSHEAS